jgi:predicted dehydrogenase
MGRYCVWNAGKRKHSMKKIHEIVWGVIGAGKVCEKKSMPAMQIIPHSRVKTVMRRNAGACRDFAARHKIPVWTTDASRIFKDPEINAVYIATPPDSHAFYCKAAAKAGKIVYVEKPMARNYPECLEMIRDCQKAGVPLFVAYYRRMLPHFRRVRELLEQDAIGVICSVHINFNRPVSPDDRRPHQQWRVQPEISGGGHFHDLASHQLDLLDYLLGPLEDVKGIAVNRAGLYEPADTVTAVFRSPGGIAGSGNWCFATAESELVDEISITGTKGSLKFSTFAHARIQGVLNTGEILRETFVLPEHIQELLLRSLIADVRGEGSCPSTGESAARCSRVLDNICS